VKWVIEFLPHLVLRQQQRGQTSGHNFYTHHHIVNADIFIRFMRQFQNGRPVGDTAFQFADAVDVFLIVGAGAGDKLRRQTDEIIGLFGLTAMDGTDV